MASVPRPHPVHHIIRLLAVREVSSHPTRTALTVTGVAIGTAVVVAVLALNASVLGGFQGMVDTLAGGADLQVRGGAASVPTSVMEELQGLEGVESVGGYLENWLLDSATGERILCVGVDFLSAEPAPGLIDKDAITGEAVEQLVGDPYEFLNSTDRMIVNDDYAARLPIRRGESRRYSTPQGPKTLKVAGILKDSAATRALGGAVALMSLDAAQILFGKPDKVDVINIKVREGASVEAVRRRIAEKLDGRYTVEAPERRGKRLARMMLTLTTVMRLVSVVAMMVGAFIVQNTLAIAVVQRRKSIAIQRALGVTRRMAWFSMMMEAAVLALIGAFMGAPLGLWLAKRAMGIVSESVSILYAQVRPSAPTLSGLSMVLVALGAVITAMFAAMRPAMAAASVPPAAVLAARGQTSPLTRTISPVYGLKLAGMALLLAAIAANVPNYGSEPWLGYMACLLVLAAATGAAPATLIAIQALALPLASRISLPLRLGAEGLTRDGPRSATTASALMLGLSLYIGISGVVTSYKTTLLNWVDLAVPADLSVLAGSSLPDAQAVPMEPSLGEDLANDPGVATMFHQRFRNIDLGDNVTKIQAMDAKAYLTRARLPVVESTGPVTGEAMEAGELLLSENIARVLGKHAGEFLEIPTPTGPHRMPIRAVVEDYSSESGAIFMDWAVYKEAFQDPLVDAFYLYLKPGADPNAVRTRLLAKHGEGRGLQVVTHTGFKRFVEDVVDNAFSATRALELVAVLIALMGIINTLFAGVLDRLREIGVMRAVGATRGQVMLILTSEAVLLGLAASVLAAAAGVAFGWVFTVVVADSATGWRLAYHVPVQALVESTLLALVVAAVASAVPARQGAVVNVVKATQVE